MLRAPCKPTLFFLLGIGVTQAAPAFAQRVFVVAPSPGPGVFSTQIQPAVDAAIDGDFVVVKGGAYGGFTIDGKSVAVVADFGANVSVLDRVAVRNLSATQRAQLCGLQIVGGFVDAFLIESNAGIVWIEQCSVLLSSLYFGARAVRIVDSDSVTWMRGALFGSVGYGTDILPGTPGGDGLAAQNSNVALYDVSCTGGAGGSGSVSGGSGGRGASVLGGSLFASGCVFHGGAGGGALIFANIGAGGAGLALGGNATAFAIEPQFMGGNGNPPAPPLEGASLLMTLPGLARHFKATSPVRELQSTTFTALGLAGERVGALFGPSPDPGLLLLLFDGIVHVSLASADALSLGTIPASGMLTLPMQIPALPPTVLGTTLFIQAFFYDLPTTYLVLGPASALVVLDSSL